MIMNKFKKLMSKKIILYSCILLFTITGALAFIPHYSCACGEIKKADGSLLSHHFGKIVENIANVVRPIFN
jgi:hypothetical protein